MIYTISNGKYELSVNSLGAELVSLKTESGFDAIWQSGGKFWTKHAPLLFPVCGRIKDGKYTVGGKEFQMTTHGFINKCEFSLVENTGTRLTLIKESDSDTLAIYPFEFIFTAEYSIDDTGACAKFKIENKSGKTMPYMFGWHPAFSYPQSAKRLEDLSLHFGDCESVLYNPLMNSVFVNPVAEKIQTPCGKYKIESKFLYDTDTIILSGTNNFVTLKEDFGSYALTLSWSDNLPHLCIWKYPDNDARYLCLEPWSSLPNDGNTDENFDTRAMRRIEPFQAEIFTYNIKIDN